MTPNPFSHNKPGPLRVGDLVRVKKICSEGAVLEKPYDATTVEDMNKHIRRMNHELIYVGKKREKK